MANERPKNNATPPLPANHSSESRNAAKTGIAGAATTSVHPGADGMA